MRGEYLKKIIAVITLLGVLFNVSALPVQASLLDALAPAATTAIVGRDECGGSFGKVGAAIRKLGGEALKRAGQSFVNLFKKKPQSLSDLSLTGLTAPTIDIGPKIGGGNNPLGLTFNSKQFGQNLANSSVGKAAANTGKSIAGSATGQAVKKFGKSLGGLGGGAANFFTGGIGGSLFKSIGFGGGGTQDVKIVGDKTGLLEDIADNTSETEENTSKVVKKECVYKPFVRVLAAMLIRTLTKSLVGWIQGDGTGRDVGFVSNFQKTLKEEVDLQAGEFLNRLTRVNLCGGGNLNRYLRVKLQTPYHYDDAYGLGQQLGCTATGIVRGVKYTYQNFQQDFTGGWPALLIYSLEPQNNPEGQFLIALEAKIAAENARAQQIGKEYDSGNGFLGRRVTEKYNCERVPKNITDGLLTVGNSYNRAIKQLEEMGAEKKNGLWVVCQTRTVIKTPGETVGYLLNKTLGLGLDQAVVTNEIDNLISATISATINRLINGKGVFDVSSDLKNAIQSEVDTEDKTSQGEDEEIDIPLIADVARADTALKYLDLNVITPTIQAISLNLSGAGAELLVPETGDSNQPRTVIDPSTAQSMREFARQQIASGLLSSKYDFQVLQTALEKKLALKNVKKELLQKLFEIMERDENIQASAEELELTDLEGRLDAVTADLPVPGKITLTGTLEKNLRRLIIGVRELADNASNKVFALQIDFYNLPTLENSPEKLSRVQNLSFDLVRTQNDLNARAAKIDPEQINTLPDEGVRNYISVNQDNFLDINQKSYQTDESILNIIGYSLDITAAAPSAAGQTAPAPVAPASPPPVSRPYEPFVEPLGPNQ